MDIQVQSCSCNTCQSGFKKLFWDKLYPISVSDEVQLSPVSFNFALQTSKFKPPKGFLVNHNNLELKRTIKYLIPEGYKFSRKATRVVKPREIVKLLKLPKAKLCKKNIKTGLIVCKMDD